MLLRTHSILIIYSCACSISFNLKLLLPCYYPIPLFHIVTLSHFFWYNALSYFKFQLRIIAATTVSYYTYTLIVAAWLFGFHFQLLWIVASRYCLLYLENPSIDRCLSWLFYSVNRKVAGCSPKLKRFHHEENRVAPLHFFYLFLLHWFFFSLVFCIGLDLSFCILLFIHLFIFILSRTVECIIGFYVIVLGTCVRVCVYVYLLWLVV